MKHCQLGDHMVPALWKAKTKTEPSACKECYHKKKSVIEQMAEYVHDLDIAYLKLNKAKKKYKKVASSNTSPTTHPNAKDDKSIPELLKLATIAFNRWIKRRDAGTIGGNCISCGVWYPVRELQAGHYMSSTYSSLRFNELNVNIECEKCNCGDQNHLKFYRINLIKKIGLEKVEELESTPIAKFHKWDREELLEITNKYK